MTARRPDYARGARSKLAVGLVLIAAVFVGQGVFNALMTRREEGQAQSIYANSLASIIEVARIARDVDQTRIVVDNHVFEKEATGMAADERQLASIAEDIQAAQSAYEPLTELPNEAQIWRAAEAALGRFDAIVAGVIELSRKNKDDEARARMSTALGDYSDLSRLLDDLIQLNRAGAYRATERVRALEQKTLDVQFASRLVGLSLVLLVGWWGARNFRSRPAGRAPCGGTRSAQPRPGRVRGPRGARHQERAWSGHDCAGHASSFAAGSVASQRDRRQNRARRSASGRDSRRAARLLSRIAHQREP